MTPFDIRPVKGKLLEDIKGIVKKKLGKKVINAVGICGGKIVKTRKIIIKNNPPLRLDINFPMVITRLQMVATQTDIEIPKVIFVHKKYKFSEWIDGVMIKDAWNISEVFVKSGDLIGRLNLIKDPVTKQFLINSEFSSTNAIWTPDGKVYIVDHGRMKTSSNPDSSVVQILLKRIRSKERINLFLKAYSKYRNIDNIMKTIEKKNWNWNSSKMLITNPQKLI